jgi:hypothetical protein
MALPKLRPSTVIFLAVVAVVILLANIPGQVVTGPRISADGQYEPFFELSGTCQHGWPFTFLVRRYQLAYGWPPCSLQSWFALWNLSEGVVDWSWLRLAGDFVIGLVSLFAAGLAFETWRRRRGHLQFHLIDVFAAFAAVACGMAYWATRAKDRDGQEYAIKQLQNSALSRGPAEWSMGGPTWLRMAFDGRAFTVCDRVVGVDVSGKAIAQLSNLRNLKRVRVFDRCTSNSQLDALRALPELEALELLCCYPDDGDTPASRVEYLRLPPLPYLRGLNLSNVSFCGEGLEFLDRIEVLNVSGTAIDDSAMPKFKALQNLRTLSLVNTRVTDAGLEHLEGLTQLRRLWIGNKKTTDQGIERLQQALPNCKIEKIE